MTFYYYPSFSYNLHFQRRELILFSFDSSELPRGGPHIQGFRRTVVAGENLRLNCTSLKSRPAAELFFLINDRYIKVYFNLSIKIGYIVHLLSH